MPKNVRNFWLEARADGQRTTSKLGPVAKDGGMDATLYIRSDGEPVRAVDLICRNRGGQNVLQVVFYDTSGKEIETKTLSVPR